MQNGPIKALLMSVIFMYHSFLQDNPRDIFQNCFIVTGWWHVLKHGNKIKANLVLVPSVGSTSSLPQSNQFPVDENWFPNSVKWLFISKTMILAALWNYLEYSLMVLANFYSAWSDQREAEVTARTCLTINHRWSHVTSPPPLGSQTPEIGESLPSSNVNIRAKPINYKTWRKCQGLSCLLTCSLLFTFLNMTFWADSKKLDLSLECWLLNVGGCVRGLT